MTDHWNVYACLDCRIRYGEVYTSHPRPFTAHKREWRCRFCGKPVKFERALLPPPPSE